MAPASESSPLWSFGFRPFFLLAAGFSIIAVAGWALMFTGGLALPTAGLPPVLWHGHEMLFGYAAAVIAGFLLTAVRNWTQLPTLQGRPLALLALCWLLPRLLFFIPVTGAHYFIVLFDLAFIGIVLIAITRPIVASGQMRRQAGIVSKIGLLALSNMAFYAGFLMQETQWMQVSVYSALYLIAALCLALARRLIPFFIKAAAGVALPETDVLDRASLVVFLLFWLAIISVGHGWVAALLAGLLFVIHAARLWSWRSAAILRSPLLWVLYAAYGFFLLGFMLLALMPLLAIPLSAAIHALAVGGIGTLTIGMMSRVSWGHTGRNIGQPPRGLTLLFVCMLAAALLRVFGPVLWPAYYATWINVSAAGWVIAFILFLFTYFPVLVGPRASA